MRHDRLLELSAHVCGSLALSRSAENAAIPWKGDRKTERRRKRAASRIFPFGFLLDLGRSVPPAFGFAYPLIFYDMAASFFDDRTQRIRELNDAFRKDAGNHLYTIGLVSEFGVQGLEEISKLVTECDNYFLWGNYRDRSYIRYMGQKIFWEICYYDKNYPPFPSISKDDPEVTLRVLTIMLESEC